MTILGRLKAAARSFVSSVAHPKQGGWWRILLPNTDIDFAKYVGDGMGSNVFMAVVLWVWRASLESRVALLTDSEDGETEYDYSHPIVALIDRPNPFTSGLAMRLAVLVSWFCDGNVYLLKARDGTGAVRQLWYAPHWMIEPVADEDDPGSFVSFFRYKPGGGLAEEELAPSEVVHLKNGQDPRDVRKGFSYLKLLLREIFNDDESANFVAALLLNGGVPGVIISPKDANTANEESLKATKDYIGVNFGRSKRGKPMAVGAPTEVKEFGYDPDKMNLDVVRNVSEERVCAGLGMPAAVVGFGSGMEQTQVGATLQELHRIAWIGCVIPNQDLIMAEMTGQLAADFRLSANQRLGWDRKKVRALQEDMNKETERVDLAIRGGWAMVSEGRAALGLPVDDSHKIFLRSFSVVEVLANGEPKDPPPAEPAALPGGQQLPKAMKAKLTHRQQVVLRAMDRVAKQGRAHMLKRVSEFFASYGKAVARAYLESERKDASDEVRVETLFGSVNVHKLRQELRGVFATHYLGVFRETRAALVGLDIGVNMPDSAETEILARGGTQAGLVDLTRDAKAKALKIIEKGRADGKSPEEIAGELEEAVPAGRFEKASTRAELIARTETRVAQTESALLVYEHADGVDQVMVIDARLGPTDADCEEADGVVTDFETARGMVAAEHPNGTRDILPVFTEAR